MHMQASSRGMMGLCQEMNKDDLAIMEDNLDKMSDTRFMEDYQKIQTKKTQ